KPATPPDSPPRSGDPTRRAMPPSANIFSSPTPWTREKKTGVRKTPKAVTPIMPQKTATPSDLRISAPAPVAMTRGTTPRMKGRQGQEDADDGEREDVDGGVAGPDLHEHHLGELRPHRDRQRLARDALDVLDDPAAADARGEVAVDRRRRVQVVARGEDRAAHL